MGMTATIGIELKNNVQNNSSSVGSNFQPMASNNGAFPYGPNANPNSPFKPMSYLQSSNELYGNLTDSMTKLNDVMKKVIESFKVFSEQLEQRNSGGSSSANNSFFNRKPIGEFGNLAISGFQTAVSQGEMWNSVFNQEERNLINGGINRKGISTARGVGSTFNAIGSIGFNPAVLAATGGWSAIAGVIGLLGGAISNGVAEGWETDAEKSDLYESYLPSMSKFLASYGNSTLSKRNISGFNKYHTRTIGHRNFADPLWDENGKEITARTNDQVALDYVVDLGKSDNVNTGLTTPQFLEYMSSLAKYGIKDEETARKVTNQAARTARAYNGNINTELAYMGTLERYGQNGVSSLRTVQGAIQQLKIEPNQLEEILNGIQSSIEDGVSKGYLRNSDDMTKTLAMLAQASGGSSFWTGKNGVARLQQMQSGLSEMGKMDSTESMIVYRAFDGLDTKNILSGGNSDNSFTYLSGDSYLNTIAAIESGIIDEDSFNGIRNNLNAMYGTDRESIVEAYKKIYGLNTEGAIQLYNMGDFEESKYKKIQDDPTLKDGETQKQNVLNEIKDSAAEAGEALDQIWEHSEAIEKDFNVLLKQRSLDDLIKFWENEAQIPGLSGLKQSVLPELYQAAAEGITDEQLQKYKKYTFDTSGKNYGALSYATRMKLAQGQNTSKDNFWGASKDESFINAVVGSGNTDSAHSYDWGQSLLLLAKEKDVITSTNEWKLDRFLQQNKFEDFDTNNDKELDRNELLNALNKLKDAINNNSLILKSPIEVQMPNIGANLHI